MVPAEYLRGLRALIVDDNSTNRRILQHQLVRWGMRVESASDGTDALAMLKVSCDSGDPYKLVLLDAQMPHMSGFEVAAMIQAEPRLQGSAVMMLSSIDLMADSAQSRRLDIRRYLVKPVTEADLRSAVLQIISPGSKLSEVPRAKPLAAGSATRAFKILLAEDNQVNQRLAVRMLEKRGHTVRCAGRRIRSPDSVGQRIIRSRSHGCTYAPHGWTRLHARYPRPRK